MVLLTVTGAMRTTATDMLEAHSNLLPLHLLLEKICYRSAARLATLPQNHPLSKIVRKSAKRQVKQHRTAIHKLFAISGINPAKVENIPPTRL